MKKFRLVSVITAIIALLVAVYSGILAYSFCIEESQVLDGYVWGIQAIGCVLCAVAYIRFAFLKPNQLASFFPKLYIWFVFSLFSNIFVGIVAYCTIVFAKEQIMKSDMTSVFKNFYESANLNTFNTEERKSSATNPEELSLEDIDYLRQSSKITKDEYETLKQDILNKRTNA